MESIFKTTDGSKHLSQAKYPERQIVMGQQRPLSIWQSQNYCYRSILSLDYIGWHESISKLIGQNTKRIWMAAFGRACIYGIEALADGPLGYAVVLKKKPLWSSSRFLDLFDHLKHPQFLEKLSFYAADSKLPTSVTDIKFVEDNTTEKIAFKTHATILHNIVKVLGNGAKQTKSKCNTHI